MFGIVHRRVLMELAGNFAAALGALLALILIGRLLQLRELLLNLDLSLWDLVQLLFYLSPFFMLLLIPISCMVSVFLTFLRMSTDKELLALKACGLSLYRLLPAPLVFCLFLAGVSMFNSLWGLAWGMQSFQDMITTKVNTKVRVFLQPGVFNTVLPNIVFYVKRIDPNTKELEHVFLKDKTRKESIAIITARRGRIGMGGEGKGELTVTLEQGNIYRHAEAVPTGLEVDTGDGTLEVLGFDSYVFRFPLSKMLSGYDFGDPKPKEMSFGELLDLNADTLVAQGKDENYARKIAVEVQKRLSMPMACLVLGLFAMPVACLFQGLKQHWGLVLSVCLFLFYYALLSMGMSLGEAGVLGPAFGLWLPNLLFAAIAVYVFRVAAKERNVRVLAWIRHRLAALGRGREARA